MTVLLTEKNPEVSVVIPTYNRIDQLQCCLEALQNQELAPSKVEIIVVDDGSTDNTYDRLQPLISSGAVHYFRQTNKGPAAARNAGIRAARGRIILFLGDDIIATPTLLLEHISFHDQNKTGPIAVLGFTDWAKNIEATPLMQYDGIGAQFGYQCIEKGEVRPDNLPFNFFYTSNVSILRQFLLDHDLFFDEDFTYAMGEDGELAYRMQQRGLHIVYHPKAIAYHDHPTTFAAICRRSFLKGQVAILQVMKHPELGDLSFLNLNWRGKLRHWTYRQVAQTISPFLKFVDDRRWNISRFGLHKLYNFVFKVHQFEGLRTGLREYNVDVRAFVAARYEMNRVEAGESV